MKVTTTPLPGLLIIKPKVFADDRGFFVESLQVPRFAAHGTDLPFVQDNHSRSAKGILRGLHYTVRRPQAQTVYVSHGRIYDVAVDLRHNSPAFGKWFGINIDGDAPRVPSERADVHYKTTETFDHGDEYGLRWNDPDMGIAWPVADPSLKPREAAFPLLRELGVNTLPEVIFQP